MRNKLNPIRIADDVFEIRLGSSKDAQLLATHLRTQSLAEDIVAGMETVAIRFHPHDSERVKEWLKTGIDFEAPVSSQEDALEIPIQYGQEYGPDLERVCAMLGLSKEAFIEQHSGATHTVEMIGFTPGFAYISGMPKQMTVSRLPHPRPRVAAGSVGISSGLTGIYALPGPGGWPLIGRTTAPLFLAQRDPPFLLKPRQCIKFKAI